MPRLLLALLAVCPVFAAADGNSAVDAIFADLTKPGSPGYALGVYRSGKLIYAKGYGLANVEQQVPITSASVFDIGSTSKQFTAASILLLEKQGKLRLDDDVRKYIPELPSYPEPAGGKITILHLLNHTSGIRDYLTLFALAGINFDGVTTDDTALTAIARQEGLNFPPGSDFLYSNSGYFLLSQIVLRVSGKTLRQFAAENIFKPLEMVNTQYRADHRSLIPNRALAYDPANGGGFQLDVSYFEQIGDGAVHTSVVDLLKWDENFYTGQAGGKELIAELRERGKLVGGKTLDYAKGLTLGTHRGLSVVSHGGSWGGYRAELMRFPEQHFSVACLCNLGTADPTSRARKVAEVYLATEMKPAGDATAVGLTRRQPPPASQVDPGELSAFSADYFSPELGVIYRLGVVDGKLARIAIRDAAGFSRPIMGLPTTFRPTAADQFGAGGLTMRFQRDSQRAVTGFIVDAGRTKGIVFKRTADRQ